jgi:hypothetical protein
MQPFNLPGKFSPPASLQARRAAGIDPLGFPLAHQVEITRATALSSGLAVIGEAHL